MSSREDVARRITTKYSGVIICTWLRDRYFVRWAWDLAGTCHADAKHARWQAHKMIKAGR